MAKLLLLLIFVQSLFAQVKTEEAFVQFTDMVTDDNAVYGLTHMGMLHVWDIKSHKKLYTATDTTKAFTSIAKDTANNIYLGNRKGCVFKLNKQTYTRSLFYKLNTEPEINFICFNGKNQLYVITPKGIYSTNNKRTYRAFYNRELSGMGFIGIDRAKDNKRFFLLPDIVFTDSSNRIWMAKNFGEFGTMLYIFNTNYDVITDNVPAIDFIQSFTEDSSKNVYVTCGLQHFFNHGSIYKIYPSLQSLQIFDSKNGLFNENPEPPKLLYIGPGYYDKDRDNMYISSSKGFYMADVSETGTLNNAKHLFEPELTYLREPLAIGAQMAVKQIEILPDNRMIYRTAANGIWIYDGKEAIKLEM